MIRCSRLASSARYYAGGDAAARHPYHQINLLSAILKLVCPARMHYKSIMLSVNRRLVAAAVSGLSLALIAGCGTPKPQAAKQAPAPGPAPAPVTLPPMVPTPRPFTPPANPTISDSGDSMETNILAWDATSKDFHAQPGDKIASFSFSLTNVSTRPVVIYDTKTSCDCTVAKLPSQPWTIPSGGSGQIDATIDLAGKLDTVTNSIVVFTSQGNRRLNVKAYLPETKK